MPGKGSTTVTGTNEAVQQVVAQAFDHLPLDGKLIDQVGYHVRDYFVKQWDRFKDIPGSILAHSTHVKGTGTYDPNSHIETPQKRSLRCLVIEPQHSNA